MKIKRVAATVLSVVMMCGCLMGAVPIEAQAASIA